VKLTKQLLSETVGTFFIAASYVIVAIIISVSACSLSGNSCQTHGSSGMKNKVV